MTKIRLVVSRQPVFASGSSMPAAKIVSVLLDGEVKAAISCTGQQAKDFCNAIEAPLDVDEVDVEVFDFSE